MLECLGTVSPCISIPRFLYTVRNERFVALCRMCLRSVAIGVRFRLLTVGPVVSQSLKLSVSVLSVKLIGRSASVNTFLSLAGEGGGGKEF